MYKSLMRDNNCRLLFLQLDLTFIVKGFYISIAPKVKIFTNKSQSNNAFFE